MENNQLLEIINYCANNYCTPSTIIFKGGRTSGNLGVIAKHWDVEHWSISDPNSEPPENEGLSGLRSIILEGSSSEKALSFLNFSREYKFYEGINKLIRRGVETSMKVDSFDVIYQVEGVSVMDIFDSDLASISSLGGMRKVSSNYEGRIPRWFLSRKDILQCKIGDHEFRVGKNVVARSVKEDVSHVVTSMGVKIVDKEFTRFSTTLRVYLSKPWKKHIFADIVTNNRSMNHLISLREHSEPIFNRKYISCCCLLSKFNIIDDHMDLKVRVFYTKCHEESLLMEILISTIFRIYEDLYDETNEEYNRLFGKSREPPPREYKGIKELRKIEPDLFINNYTRECPILPVVDVHVDKERYQYLEYHGVSYRAPDGYYVGLKKNRLPNKDKFEYLVTCYKTNHMIRRNSITYKYLTNTPVDEPSKLLSFSECVRQVVTDVNSVDKSVCKQELWYRDDIDDSDDSCYRYLEEVYKCNIIVVTTYKGESRIYIPDHRDEYIWDPNPYKKCLVVNKVFPPKYTNQKVRYQVAVSSLEECKELIKKKLAITCRGSRVSTKDPKYQYLNSSGKCVTVVDEDGREERCYCRPFPIPAMERKESVLSRYSEYLNELRRDHGMEEVKTRGTDNKYVFFPNEESWESYRSSF
jgi:hypothetical protein